MQNREEYIKKTYLYQIQVLDRFPGRKIRKTKNTLLKNISNLL